MKRSFTECSRLKTEIVLVWWYTPVIPALRRLEQEDQEFKASLGYPESSRPGQQSKTLPQKIKIKKRQQ
jgi:hypothetical protein